VAISDDCGNNTVANISVAEKPVPTASASAGPACTGQDLQLTGGTDIGNSFSWTGPDGFVSSEQNPLITDLSEVNEGTYTFIASLNGCDSPPSEVQVWVNDTPVIVSISALPASVCLNGSSQLNVVASTVASSPYCIPVFTGTSFCNGGDYIAQVSFAGINRSSLCDGNVSPGYSFFATPQATVVAGTSYPFNVLNGPDWSMGLKVYIDLNQDGVYDEASELLFTGTAGAGVGFNGSIAIPASALNGQTRVRFVGRFSSVPIDACTVGSSFGEVEEYLVNITGGAPNSLDYSWSPTTYLDNPNIANPTAGNALVTTDYTVTVTGPSGCVNTADVTLNVVPSLNVNLEINTDLSGSQTTWEITDATSNAILCSGGPYIDNFQLNAVEVCCLPEGCYILRVFDSGGDGMVNGFNGGYQLRFEQPDNRRIIDNQQNGAFGSVSQITGNAYSFCMPIGDVEPIYTSCDKYWWRTGEFLVATPDDDVSAEWIVGAPNSAQSTTSGYEFWFYNPNGGYSFRRFRNHRTSDGFGPASAVRACHMKVNNWAVANHIPQFDLMNVRIRTVINGVNGLWGPACRFVRNEVLGLCPPTKLMDIPGNQFLSCGQFRQFGVPGQRVHSRPVAQATQYEWRFRIPAENTEIIRTSTGYFLNLNWGAAVADPLEPGKTYEVDVRAFRNGAWCVDPLNPDSAWGDICLLTIIGTPAQDGTQNLALQGEGFNLWPNPNRGDQFWINLEGIADDVQTIALDIHDLAGKRIVAREIPVTDSGMLNTVIDLNGDLANGMYMVSIIAGDLRYTERLVIAN
jgi:hypothetical protein